MSLQLILGGSGSGKTTYLYEHVIQASIKRPDRMYFIIVPEQFTMQAQKDIVTLHPNHGTMNIDVVSFQRLAYRIFEELAVENLQILDDMGKSMVLRKVAANHRRNLILFQGHLGQTGFINQLKSTLSEFYQYGVTPEILREMALLAKIPLFRQKLEDFAVIFQGFADYIAGHYITTEEVLDVLCRVLPQSQLVKNSIIALDGYAGFMPVQYRLLQMFLLYAQQVVVTVTADLSVSLYKRPGMQNLFYMSSQIVCRLTRLAEENQVKKLPDRWMSGQETKNGKIFPRFLQSPELAFLEANLFRYRRENEYKGRCHGGIELHQAANPSEEIRYVIHRIQGLLRDSGMRYRDMAIVTGDLAGYGNEIAGQLERSGIPFFIDDKKNILDNPMAELIRASLEVVRRDFSYESVFRFLRSGLVAINREMTDRMENYVLAMGIRGYKRWQETWERTCRGLAGYNLTEINSFRDQVMKPLFDLREAFGQEHITVAGRVQAVRQLLETCQVQEKLEAYQEYFTSRGEYRLAKEYGQVYELIDDLLERLADLLGEEQVGRKEFMEILDAGFSEISVGAIPATVDRIVVGDITRSRLAHIRVLFFVGINDGIIPMRKSGGSLLSDQEREFFSIHDVELAPSAREDSFQQRFYLYLMMTKPSEKLILSYAAVGSDGKSRRASYLIGEMQKMFPGLKGEGEQENVKIAYSSREGWQQLIDRLRKFRLGEFSQAEDSSDKNVTEQQFFELYRWFYASPDYREAVKNLVEAAFYIYEKQGIGHAVARALYGNILSGSVTRLEQYAACAYGHFLKYGLELMERQRYELAAADLGNLFHYSIDQCFRQVQAEGKDWRTITEEERKALVHQCVERVTSEYGNTILGSSSRNAYLAQRVENITQRTIWALQQQILRGDFVPAGFEVSFSAADNLEAMKISLSADEELHLRGRIDRLDLCEDGKQVYVKIIDYKSGSTSFDLLAIYYGLQLQLVVYMDAVLEMTSRRYPNKEVLPAGILYYNIADPLADKEGKMAGGEGEPDREAIEREILQKLRMNGLINSEIKVIRHLDSSIEKESDIIPVVLKNEEVQQGRSSVANGERFAYLRRYVHEKVREAGQDILRGEIGVEPYKSGVRTACDYCPYHAVCGFDKKTSGYEYRRLKSKKTEEIWEELCQ